MNKRVRVGQKRSTIARAGLRTPTQVITGAPNNKERTWAKKPRERIVRISDYEKEKPLSSASRYLEKGETMEIHTHVPHKGVASAIPSLADLLMFQSQKGLRTSIIAQKAKNGEVQGYNFIRPKKGTKNFLKQWKIFLAKKFMKHLGWRGYLKLYPNMAIFAYGIKYGFYVKPNGELNEKLFSEDLIRARKEIEKNGFKMRFVPNKNAGYSWNGSRFVKIEEK